MDVVIDMEKTGKRIEELRKAAGISVKELTEMFGFSAPQAVYKWQKGITLPSVDSLVILARIFKVSMDDIIVVKAL